MLPSFGVAYHRRLGKSVGNDANATGMIDMDVGKQYQLRGSQAKMGKSGYQMGGRNSRPCVHYDEWVPCVDPGADETIKSVQGHGKGQQKEILLELLKCEVSGRGCHLKRIRIKSSMIL